MKRNEKPMKERILEEALQLFSQNGYTGTSMNDIAAKLGVTKAALYKHYKSKFWTALSRNHPIMVCRRNNRVRIF